MTKKQMIEYIEEKYNWFESMQLELGHHSWWYTNRTPDECINVKLHAWVDIDEVLKKLTNNEKDIIKKLDLNVEEYCNYMIWGDYELVTQARENLLDELKEKYNVEGVNYGGRNGGWLAVIYDWNEVFEDYIENYSYQEIKGFYNTIKKAVAEHDRVTELVLERKKALEETIEDVGFFVDGVKSYVCDLLEEEQTKAKEILLLSN